MKKILAIGASNSSKSINTAFATYIAGQLQDTEVTVFDWSEFVLPLFGVDLEIEIGVPKNAQKFNKLIESSDAIVISLAEHNGLPTAAFKNLWDWTSRINAKFWADKPMFLAAASPGGRGGASVLSVCKNAFPHFGGNIIVDFSLPKFNDNFKEGNLINVDLKADLDSKIKVFQKAI